MRFVAQSSFIFRCKIERNCHIFASNWQSAGGINFNCSFAMQNAARQRGAIVAKNQDQDQKPGLVSGLVSGLAVITADHQWTLRRPVQLSRQVDDLFSSCNRFSY